MKRNIFIGYFLVFLFITYGCERKKSLTGKWQLMEVSTTGFKRKFPYRGDSGDFLTFKDSLGYHTVEINNSKLRKKTGIKHFSMNDTVIYVFKFKYEYSHGILTEKWGTEYGKAQEKYNVLFKYDTLFLNCINCSPPYNMILVKYSN